MIIISENGKKWLVSRDKLIKKSKYWRNILTHPLSTDKNVNEINVELPENVVKSLVDYVNKGFTSLKPEDLTDSLYKIGALFGFENWDRDWKYYKEVKPLEDKLLSIPLDEHDPHYTALERIENYLYKMRNIENAIKKGSVSYSSYPSVQRYMRMKDIWTRLNPHIPYTDIAEEDIPAYIELLNDVLNF